MASDSYAARSDMHARKRCRSALVCTTISTCHWRTSSSCKRLLLALPSMAASATLTDPARTRTLLAHACRSATSMTTYPQTRRGSPNPCLSVLPNASQWSLVMASKLVRDSRHVERMDISLTWAHELQANVDGSYLYVVR